MTSLFDEVLDLTRRIIRIDSTNGNETPVAEELAAHLEGTGVECELVARDPARANLVARLPGSGQAPSLAFVGHSDVVPADPRDWTHPPFAAVVDDGGYLFGRGAIDMKNEVAARTVALAELARSGFRPRGDLWLLVVADEEDGAADVGMRWLLEQRPDIRPDQAVNEGGGQRLELSDGRVLLSVSVGEKGTVPVRVSAVGEAGHASLPTVGDNAVPLLARLLVRLGRGEPTVEESPVLQATLAALLGAERVAGVPEAIGAAVELNPVFRDSLPPLAGTTMAPTRLGGSTARNVMPARAWADLDCRVLPGRTQEETAAAVADRLGTDIRYELTFPESMTPGSSSPLQGPVLDAIAAIMSEHQPGATILPTLCTGYTDSSFLRIAHGTAAYGFSPFRTTPAGVLESGYHNADERVHVDDLLEATSFHLDLARHLLG